MNFSFKFFRAGAFAALSLAILATSCATTSSEPKKKPLSTDERVSLLVQAAVGAMDESDYVGALELLARAEKDKPNDPDVHHVRALVYMARHEPEPALIEAKKAVDAKPDFSAANNTYGKLLLDLGRNQEAEEHLTQAATDPLFRESFKARTSLGMLYYRKGELTKARQQLDRAILSAPTLACIAYYYRGHLNLQARDFPGAVKDYKSATQRTCAGFGDAHLALGIAFERSRRYDEARRKFLEIEQNFPNTQVAETAMQRLRGLP